MVVWCRRVRICILPFDVCTSRDAQTALLTPRTISAARATRDTHRTNIRKLCMAVYLHTLGCTSGIRDDSQHKCNREWRLDVRISDAAVVKINETTFSVFEARHCTYIVVAANFYVSRDILYSSCGTICVVRNSLENGVSSEPETALCDVIIRIGRLRYVSNSDHCRRNLTR